MQHTVLSRFSTAVHKIFTTNLLRPTYYHCQGLPEYTLPSAYS
jgi:hypothetical protein